ncbi:MAG: insulinase family protein, partial [Candidatus Marinimicrobia bacterium]|nr:insulinase family protein [Candidatus Neomarinimicrobiota bacterium]
TYPVPDHEETLYAIASDPEATRSSVSVYYKMDVEPQGQVKDYRQGMVESAYNRMLNSRLNELAQQADPPFLGGYSGKGRFVRSKEVYLLAASVKEGGINRGLDALLTEAKRVEEYGFTEPELDRVKKTMLRWIERAYNERDKTESSVYASEYIRNFMTDEPIPGIEYEFELYKKYVPTITLDEVNQLASKWISDNNRVIMVSVPENEETPEPTESELESVMQTVAQKDVEPYEEQVSEEPLVADTPEGSVVVSENYREDLDVTEWELENGVKVILKPTDFKNDEIRFSAYSPGGLSLVSNENYVAGQTATGVVRNSGLGKFGEVELQKKLSDKVASVSPSIGEYDEGLSGSGSPEDIETLFQLIYLHFTEPNADSSGYLSYRGRLTGYLENREADPSSAFSDSLNLILNQHHFRATPWSVEMLEDMDMKESFEIYNDRFSDASDFTFVFVGNFELESIKPYIQTYLGGLPDINREEKWQDNGMRYADGVIERTVKAGIEPKSRVQILFTGPFDWSRENRFEISAMTEVLRIKLREILREDLGGTYGVGVSSQVSRIPTEDYLVSVSFGCDPDRVEELTATVFQQIDSLKTVGTTDEYLTKVKEIRRRSYETNLKENGFWVGNLEFYYNHGQDPALILDYPALIDNLSLEDIQESANEYFDMDNYIKVVLLPEDFES